MIIEDIIEKINLNNLSAEERQELTKQSYAEPSYFQELFKRDNIDLESEKLSLAFRREISRLLVERNISPPNVEIEDLHEHVSDELKTYGFDDGVNKISTYFYDTDEQFLQVYYQFIKFLRLNYFKEPFWFQATPTIRIHCPNGKNNHHYPRYHNDIGYGHPPEEINLWLPLTEVRNGHGFRVASVAASAKILKSFNYDYPQFIHAAIQDKEFTQYCESVSQPVATPFGKVFAFDSRSIHTGEPLKEHTRASMDIRITPISRYEQMSIEYQGSGRRKILFAPGHCYHKNDSDHFLKI